MEPHRLIHDKNIPICTFSFSFSSVNSINLVHITYHQNEKYLMIDIQKTVIRYYIEHRLHYVNIYVNNLASSQMVQNSLIDKKLD